MAKKLSFRFIIPLVGVVVLVGVVAFSLVFKDAKLAKILRAPFGTTADTNNPPYPGSASTLTLTPTIWSPTVGESQVFTAVATDSSGDVISDAAISWTVSGAQTIRLSSLVGSSISATALTAGTGTIVASVAGSSATQSLTMTIIAATDPGIVTTSVILKAGWNIVTLPLVVTSKGGTIFSDHNVFAWNGTEYVNLYDSAQIPSAGQAFWYYAPTAGPIVLRNVATATALPISTTVSLRNGWNLVGSPYPKELSAGSLVAGKISINRNPCPNRQPGIAACQSPVETKSLTDALAANWVRGFYRYDSTSSSKYSQDTKSLADNEGFWLYGPAVDLEIEFDRPVTLPTL